MRTLAPLDREQNEEVQRLHRTLDAVARATAEADRAWLELSRQHANEDAERWRPAHEAFERQARLAAEHDRLKALYLQAGGDEDAFESRWQQYLDDRAFRQALESIEVGKAQERRQL